MFGFGDGPALRSLIIPNTLAFFRADVGVTLDTGKCSAWADQSGNGNDASQGTGANQFTFVADIGNGQPGMLCGATTWMDLATGVFTAGQQRWMLAVLHDTDGAGGVVFGTRTVAPQCNIFALTSGADFLTYSDGVANVASTVPAYALNQQACAYEWALTVGSAPGFSVNGAAKTAGIFAGDGLVQTDNGGSAAAVLGGFAAHVSGWVGHIQEVRLGSGVVSAPSLAAWRAYVTDRYGITIP